MTDVALIQEDFKIEMEGTVTPPPSISEIIASVKLSADRKEALTLSAGQLRVLTNYVEGLK